jgi:hypothetical protein
MGAMWRRVTLSGLLWALTLTLVVPARADVDDATRASARELGYAGVEAFQAADYAGAHAKLERAYRVLKAPSLGLWSARALEKLGRWVEASERYLEVTRLSLSGGQEAVQQQAQADALREFEALSQRVPGLRVEIRGAPISSVVLRIDGVIVAPELITEVRPVNPGSHRVEASAGGETLVSEVSVEEREHETVTLSFEGTSTGDARARPTPDVASSSSPFPRRAVAWGAIVTGGVGLVLGGVSGGLALQKRGEIDDSQRCRPERNECLPDMKSTVDSYNTMRVISTVGFVAGGALAATGIVLLLTVPSETAPSAALHVSPGEVTLCGKF